MSSAGAAMIHDLLTDPKRLILFYDDGEFGSSDSPPNLIFKRQETHFAELFPQKCSHVQLLVEGITDNPKLCSSALLLTFLDTHPAIINITCFSMGCSSVHRRFHGSKLLRLIPKAHKQALASVAICNSVACRARAANRLCDVLSLKDIKSAKKHSTHRDF